MWLSTLFLLFTNTLAFFNQEKCEIDYRSLENKWEEKVMHDLVNCTRLRTPPPQHVLTVDLMFFVKSFTLDTEQQVFSVFIWAFITWRDERLQWDSMKYDGVDELILPKRTFMWKPGIKLINSIEGDELYGRYVNTQISCSLNSSGILKCKVLMKCEVKCTADLRYWPYDAQHCSLELGSYAATTKLQLNVKSKAMKLIHFENASNWKITDYQQILDENSEKQLILKFKLERHTEGLTVIVIYPSFILPALTLLSLFIDARLNDRLLVTAVSSMCHVYFITRLSWVFPGNTKDAPSLLLYYRGSFILTGILIFLSFVLRVLCKKDIMYPNWVLTINYFVNTTFARHLFLPRWKTAGVDNNTRDWTYFANIVNTAAIYLTVLVYVCLYCAFMPQPDSFNYS